MRPATSKTRRTQRANLMKIRIYDDSIRLRLDRSEVEAIGRSERVVGTTHFPGARQFTYSLSVADQPAATANLEGAAINLVVPRQAAARWANSDTEVSMHGAEALPAGTLTLLIEKDFECLEPRAGEDQSNRFANPKAGSV